MVKQSPSRELTAEPSSPKVFYRDRLSASSVARSACRSIFHYYHNNSDFLFYIRNCHSLFEIYQLYRLRR
jgi:hypothetical protein